MNREELLRLIPDKEKIVVTYGDIEHNIIYVVTENIRTGMGVLYKVLNKKLKKIESSDTPYFDEPEKFLEKERKKYE